MLRPHLCSPILLLISMVLFAALPTSLFTGCTGDDDTLRVQVCGDYQVPDDLDAIRVRLLNTDREVLHGGVRELLECPQDRIRPLPQTVTFNNVDETVTLIEVVALQDGVSFARTERRVQTRGDFRITLSTACRGAQCSLGQTCLDGHCEFTPTGSDEDCLDAADAPTDAGLDASDDAGKNDDTQPADTGDTGVDTGQEINDEPRYCPPEDNA